MASDRRARVHKVHSVENLFIAAVYEGPSTPKWRGRIVMASPESGTTGGHVASWFAWYGEDRATQILVGLKANEVRLVAGNSVAVRLVEPKSIARSEGKAKRVIDKRQL